LDAEINPKGLLHTIPVCDETRRRPHGRRSFEWEIKGMEDAQIARFQAALMARLAELDGLEAENASARAVVELDQQSVGRLSRMDALQRQAMAEETRRRRDLDRRRIKAALARIEEGEFGYCQTCGDALPAKRLEIDPTAVVCVGCAG
jgi:DnaK suppressor protein